MAMVGTQVEQGRDSVMRVSCSPRHLGARVCGIRWLYNEEIAAGRRDVEGRDRNRLMRHTAVPGDAQEPLGYRARYQLTVLAYDLSRQLIIFSNKI